MYGCSSFSSGANPFLHINFPMSGRGEACGHKLQKWSGQSGLHHSSLSQEKTYYFVLEDVPTRQLRNRTSKINCICGFDFFYLLLKVDDLCVYCEN